MNGARHGSGKGGDLQVSNLVVRYGPVLAVDGISLRVGAGRMVGIVGRNGAGKSSLMRAICGLHRASSGSVTWDGEAIQHLGASQIVGRGIAYVPEGRRIFSELSVEDNLRLGAYSRRNATGGEGRSAGASGGAAIERVLSMFPVLRERARQAGGTLSGGQQQMLAIGRALMSEPQLLLLDEPSMGLAPIVVQELFEQIRQLHQAGLSVLIVEQKAHLTLRMVDEAHVIVHGKVVASGRGEELLSSGAVQSAYLGGGSAASGKLAPSTSHSAEAKAPIAALATAREVVAVAGFSGPQLLPAATSAGGVVDLSRRDAETGVGMPQALPASAARAVPLRPGERPTGLQSREQALRELHRRGRA